MPPAPRPVSAAILKKIAEAEGFKPFVNTALNWVLKRDKPKTSLILIPREGDVVAVEALESILGQIGIGNQKYFDYLKKFNV